MISVRQARPSDREAMTSITRNVWEGHDYLPFVWDRWVAEEKGIAMVAELNGRVVGLQHGELHRDGAAWLEAIRVAEDVQGRGIGQALLSAGVEWARFAGARAVRLSTASHNPSSNRLAEKAGFEVVQRYAPLRAAGVHSDPQPLTCRVAFMSDAEPAWCLLSEAYDPARRRFYTEGWTAYGFSRPVFDALVASHQVTVAIDNQRLGAVAITPFPASRPTLKIGLMAGDAAGVRAVTMWLRNKAAEQGSAPIRATVPLEGHGTIEALEAAGFERSVDWHMVLHELTL